MADDRISVTPMAATLLGIACLLCDSALLCALLLCAAVHEGGHLLAIRLMGRHVDSVEVEFLGVSMRCETASYTQELIAASAGPAASFVLAAGLALLGKAPQDEFCVMTCGMSAVLGAFNLLPIMPLDGGRILRAWAMMATDIDAAERIVGVTGIISCLGLVGLGVWNTFASGNWTALAAAIVLTVKNILPSGRRRAIANKGEII
ncbi:MAG: M50 family metallopeptidase [Oscillospiraceae bacterium]|nr:M50 family metallopeptidase [Oscillospiraceae bacterium]